MMAKKYKARVIVTACSFALASMSGFAAAQTSTSQTEASKTKSTATGNQSTDKRSANNDTKGVANQLNQATKVVKQMERDAGMKKVLEQAQGIFIVPDYQRAAGSDTSGAEGIMLVKQKGQWTTPAFYNIGAADKGNQSGAKAGAIVMVLNNDKAVNKFMQDNSWSLNKDSGLNIVNWSEKAKESAGKSDVIVWSDKKDALGDLAFSVSDIKYDDRTTASFYGKQVAQQDVFGQWMEAPPQAASLIQALPGGTSMTSSGRSGNASSATSKNSMGGASAGSATAGSSATGQGSSSDGKSGAGSSGTSNK